MGMSTYAQAFRDLDGKFNKMLEIKRYCEKNEVSYPKEVQEYFGGKAGTEEQFLIDGMREISIGEVVREWRNDHSEGIEIDLEDLPPEVKTIRFVNSW